MSRCSFCQWQISCTMLLHESMWIRQSSIQKWRKSVTNKQTNDLNYILQIVLCSCLMVILNNICSIWGGLLTPGWRCHWQRRPCGGFPRWCMGHCVRWFMGHQWCQCGVSAAWLQQSYVFKWRCCLWWRQWSNPLRWSGLHWDWGTPGWLLTSWYWKTRLWS